MRKTQVSMRKVPGHLIMGAKLGTLLRDMVNTVPTLKDMSSWPNHEYAESLSSATSGFSFMSCSMDGRSLRPTSFHPRIFNIDVVAQRRRPTHNRFCSSYCLRGSSKEDVTVLSEGLVVSLSQCTW